MPDPLQAAHEALCRRCGRCCYEKYVVEERVFTTRTPCPHLDTRTRRCTVYDRRTEVNPRCVTVEEGIRLGVFPADCPYVQGVAGYVPSEEGWLDDDLVRWIEEGVLTRAEDVRREMERRRGRGDAAAAHRADRRRRPY